MNLFIENEQIQLQSGDYPLKLSFNIRTQTHLGQPEWFKLSYSFERFLNLRISLIHLELFQCGLEPGDTSENMHVRDDFGDC